MTTPRREDFRFINPLRVRWSEVDQQKVVFNAHYLTYFDIAITDYWRAMAIPYEASMPGLGGEPFVRKATVEFHASARLDDQLEVGLKCARIGTSSMGFVGGIFRDEQLLISSELVYVFADPHAQVSVPVPPRLREIMLGYEACEPMTRTEVGAWPALAAELLSLRQDVGLAEAEDPGDATALHVLLRNRLGLPVASGRLLPAVAGVSTIDRLGVRRVLRGSHYGRATLMALIKAAEGRGDHAVQAQTPRGSRGFFERQGFEAQGEPYEVDGAVYTTLRLGL
jgi:YbgC/YbaW family acyl-CoA thioester hydrolase